MESSEMELLQAMDLVISKKPVSNDNEKFVLADEN